MLVDVFLMLGIIVPLIGSNVMFGEQIKHSQYVGLLILLAAVFIMCSYNNSINKKLTIFSFILLLICGTSNGIADLSQKMYVKYTIGQISVAVFNFYIYLFSAVLLFAVYLFLPKKQTKSIDVKSVFGYIFVMSICLFATSYFKTKAATILSASQIYPLCQGGGLILSSCMSTVFFKEKFTVKSLVGIILSFWALIIINML